MSGVLGNGAVFEIGDTSVGSPVDIATSGNSTTNGITTITTDATHNLVRGDIVEIAAAVGGANLNTFHIVASVPSSTTFTIANGIVSATGATFTSATVTTQNTVGAAGWTKVASVTSLNPSGTANDIDVADLDDASLGFAAQEPGAPTGSFALEINFRATQATHGPVTGLQYLRSARIAHWTRITYPLEVSTNAPAMSAQRGRISTFSKTVGVNTPITASVAYSVNSAELVIPEE